MCARVIYVGVVLRESSACPTDMEARNGGGEGQANRMGFATFPSVIACSGLPSWHGTTQVEIVTRLQDYSTLLVHGHGYHSLGRNR